ncbi:MAG TPA: methyltransferase domain-containing protein [Terriglobia bacterium]|nr:methyltransferase domain-containing protein [Terriglobia bacterium]
MDTRFKLPKVEVVHGRRSVVLERCHDKRVLHLGCVDAGLLEERFARGELMHQQLASVATELWGADVDKEGIAFLRAKGFDNLICADICEEGGVRTLSSQQFDVILATEVIEHLENPGKFLKAVNRIMVPGRTEFIATVPNAFCINNFINLVRGLEVVHPDHNYWFSYRTLTTLLRKSGFSVTAVYSYTFEPGSFVKRVNGNGTKASGSSPARGGLSTFFKRKTKSVIAEALYRRSSFWGEGLIATCQVPVQSNEQSTFETR